MFSDDTIRIIASQAGKAGVSVAALLALVEIESGGKVSARVNGADKPLIRFEGHYFDRRLAGAKRNKARAAGLAAPQAGAVPNPASQEKRWAMLGRASSIDRKAALESVSWGIGQVMGSHWAWLGYASVEDLAAEAESGIGGQLRLMLRFLEKSGILPHVKARRWRDVARMYNGPGFAKNRYDTKLAAAEARWAAHLARNGTPIANSDSKVEADADVKTVQIALRKLGYRIAADGFAGPRTAAALRAFQKSKGLPETGIIDGGTRAALSAAPETRPGILAAIARMVRWMFTRRTIQP
jgi:hypothetical protein